MRKILGLAVVVFGMIFFGGGVPVFAAEEEPELFQPVFSFHGGIECSTETYFGNYPVVNEENRELGAGMNETNFADLSRLSPLGNPTSPILVSNLTLDIYSNSLEDLELFIKLKYGGMPGVGMGLGVDELYTRYYTEQLMLTAGRFSSEFGIMGLLLKQQPADQLSINTMWGNTWITLLHRRIKMNFYESFPYATTADLDELIACRISKKFGTTLVGMNLMEGFLDEKAFSIDFNGKIKDCTVKGELGLVYPTWSNRLVGSLDAPIEFIPEGVYPGGIITVYFLNQSTRQLRLSIGGLSKGFISQYGATARMGQVNTEELAKFGRNSGGIDLLYLKDLSETLHLGMDLVYLEYLDREFLTQFQRKLLAPFPTRVFEVKLTKELSATSELALGLAYCGDHSFDYGKATLKWQANF